MKKKQVFTTLFVLFYKGTIFFKEKRLNISEAYRKQSPVHATVSFQRILISEKRVNLRNFSVRLWITRQAMQTSFT